MQFDYCLIINNVINQCNQCSPFGRAAVTQAKAVEGSGDCGHSLCALTVANTSLHLYLQELVL